MIHHYFFDKNPHWKAIREEEYKAEEEDKIARDVNEEVFEEQVPAEKPALDFTPVDARHLSSLPLVRSRVVKLLKASKNYIHESNNMLITIVRHLLPRAKEGLYIYRGFPVQPKATDDFSKTGLKN